MRGQDKDPDGSKSVERHLAGLSRPIKPEHPDGNSTSSNSTKEDPIKASIRPDHNSDQQILPGILSMPDNSNLITKQPSPSTQHSSKHLRQLVFEQEHVRLAASGWEDQMTEKTRHLVDRVSKIVENSDLDSFLQYKEEALSTEEALGPGSNYFFLSEALERLEYNIRAGNGLSKLDWDIDTGSQESGDPASSGTVGTGQDAARLEDGATVESGPSKNKKVGQDNVTDSVSAEEDVDKTAQEEAAKNTEAPKKKSKKRRGKKKAQHRPEEGGLLTEIKTPPASGPSGGPSVPCCPAAAAEASAEQICGHSKHSRCTHTTWRNDDTQFSRALADTIRELLSTTPLNSKLKLELHVDMNKVKRRVDEVEAADGDVSILRAASSTNSGARGRPPIASATGPFSSFGKVVTPELQRAVSIHLLSSPKYYNGFLDYIEHLNYLVACGDEKAGEMADEADLVYNVVTAVYKEMSDMARSKVTVNDEMTLTESEIREKRLAESAKKMRELQELEQGIRLPDTLTSTTEEASHQSTPAKDTNLDATVLSIIKQPAVLRRFITDYKAMQTNPGAYSALSGQESHLLYQRLVDIKAAPALDPPRPSQASPKAPLSPESAIDALLNSSSNDETYNIGFDYLSSSEVTPEARQTVASFYAVDDAKLATFISAKTNIEEQLKENDDIKLRKMRDEAEKIWVAILEQVRARELEDPEAKSEATPAPCNPFKARDFVDKVMRAFVEEFSTSPPGNLKFIWPLKFIAEHPSIHAKVRASAVCLLADTAHLFALVPLLQRAMKGPWQELSSSDLGKLDAQEHLRYFMHVVGFMKECLESAPRAPLQFNANKNQSILPLTKRAGLPIKAQVLYNIRDYESAYTAALDDKAKLSVNKAFCLPHFDSPKYFRETAEELYSSALDHAAFIEQKNNLANLPACFGDAEIRQTLVASALMIDSALAELDASSGQNRRQIMEAVATSSSYSISPPMLGPLAVCSDAYASFIAAVQKVEANFVREDVHYQVPYDRLGLDKSAGFQKVETHNKHAPYVLGKYVRDAVTEAKPVAKAILYKPQEPTRPLQKTSTNHGIPETPREAPDELSPSQQKLKKQLIAANFRNAQKAPLPQPEIQARARRVLGDSMMLSSFFKSKKAMEYGSRDEDSPDEKFALNEINRTYAEMKKIKVDIDAEIGPQKPAIPTSSFTPPPAAQLSAPKKVDKKGVASTTNLPKSPTRAIQSPPDPVTVHHPDFDIRPGIPTPIIPRDCVIVYSALSRPTRPKGSLQAPLPPLPSDTELAKECVIFETARAQRETLAAFYAESPNDYASFVKFRRETEDAVQDIDETTDEGLRARNMLIVLKNVNLMVQSLKIAEGLRDKSEDTVRVEEAALDTIVALDDRPRLMLALETLEELYGDEPPSSRQDLDAKPLVGLEFAKRLDKLVVSTYYGLFKPTVTEDGKSEGENPEANALPESIVDNVARPFTGKKISKTSRKQIVPTLANPADVIELALDYYPELSDLASGSLPPSSCGKDSAANLSETKIQKVLGGLDAMPVPPQVVADLYKTATKASKVPRFTDGEEAVAYMQSQMERVTASVSVSVSSNVTHSKGADSPLINGKYGVSISEEYTVVPDLTPEGQALGKAIEDIQLSAYRGDVPTDYQMAALGKARRELYASRHAKTPLVQPATTGHPNNAPSKPHPSLSVSARAENRAAANLMARSEAVALVGMKSLPSAQPAAPSQKPRHTSFSPVGFPLPGPAPEPQKSLSAPRNDDPDALQMPLRAAITAMPVFAHIDTMIGVQRQVNNLFSGVNKIKEFQECRASLGLPDPTSAEGQALSSLNEIFVTYKAIHMVEEDRLDQLLDRAHQYHNGVVFAIEEARRRSLRLDATLERVDDYNLCNKRSPAAMLNKGQLAALDREMMALTEELETAPHANAKRVGRRRSGQRDWQRS
ncbi:hypothetical protein O988_01206 [Pseudogymnoascus sp. VKM F-3808]|nr:hypothetical protein O988_01206 [Pseudogymnoascus sp. VKM F-3808]